MAPTDYVGNSEVPDYFSRELLCEWRRDVSCTGSTEEPHTYQESPTKVTYKKDLGRHET